MFISPAYAQAAGAAPQSGMAGFLGLAPLFLVFIVFYFLMIRPQQRRMKAHQAMVAALKRGDTVVLNSGVIGKVARVDDGEASIEIAANTTVKVVKTMISEVRVRGEPAPANDAKIVS